MEKLNFGNSSSRNLHSSSSSSSSVEQRMALSPTRIERARKCYEANIADINQLPRAQAGGSNVRIPKGDNFVIKNVGNGRSRFARMCYAQTICEKYNYRQLVVPRGFVEVQGLPIFLEEKMSVVGAGGDFKTAIGWYVEHASDYDDAVREFVQFLCRTELLDITQAPNVGYFILDEFDVDEWADLPERTEHLEIGRYDNVAFMREGGRIAFLDLEKLTALTEEEQRNLSFKDYRWRCRAAICLFPLHANLIIDTVEEMCRDIHKDIENLRTMERRLLGHFKLRYTEHAEFIRQKNPDFTDLSPSDIIRPIREQKDDILNKVRPSQGNVEDSLENKIRVFDKVCDWLEEQLTSNFQEIEEAGISRSLSGHAALRTIKQMKQGFLVGGKKPIRTFTDRAELALAMEILFTLEREKLISSCNLPHIMPYDLYVCM